jgi:hypothetical protein
MPYLPNLRVIFKEQSDPVILSSLLAMRDKGAGTITGLLIAVGEVDQADYLTVLSHEDTVHTKLEDLITAVQAEVDAAAPKKQDTGITASLPSLAELRKTRNLPEKKVAIRAYSQREYTRQDARKLAEVFHEELYKPPQGEDTHQPCADLPSWRANSLLNANGLLKPVAVAGESKGFLYKMQQEVAALYNVTRELHANNDASLVISMLEGLQDLNAMLLLERQATVRPEVRTEREAIKAIDPVALDLAATARADLRRVQDIATLTAPPTSAVSTSKDHSPSRSSPKGRAGKGKTKGSSGQSPKASAPPPSSKQPPTTDANQ